MRNVKEVRLICKTFKQTDKLPINLISCLIIKVFGGFRGWSPYGEETQTGIEDAGKNLLAFVQLTSIEFREVYQGRGEDLETGILVNKINKLDKKSPPL